MPPYHWCYFADLMVTNLFQDPLSSIISWLILILKLLWKLSWMLYKHLQIQVYTIYPSFLLRQFKCLFKLGFDDGISACRCLALGLLLWNSLRTVWSSCQNSAITYHRYLISVQLSHSLFNSLDMNFQRFPWWILNWMKSTIILPFDFLGPSNLHNQALR